MDKSSISIAIFVIAMLLTACAPSSPMKADIDILQDPIVGREVDLIIELSSSTDAPNTFLEITIPEGVLVIQGDQELWISLQRNENYRYQMKIQIENEGEYLISAYAFHRYSESEDSGGFGAGETIYVFSSKENSQVLSREDFRSKTPIGPCLNCSTLGVDPTLFADE